MGARGPARLHLQCPTRPARPAFACPSRRPPSFRAEHGGARDGSTPLSAAPSRSRPRSPNTLSKGLHWPRPTQHGEPREKRPGGGCTGGGGGAGATPPALRTNFLEPIIFLTGRDLEVSAERPPSHRPSWENTVSSFTPHTQRRWRIGLSREPHLRDVSAVPVMFAQVRPGCFRIFWNQLGKV